MSDEFFSFDEALNELRLKEEELKRLVSEGEIRAFRKGETMKLRRSDVESLRNELQGGEVVDLGEDLVEELVFEEEPSSEPAGLATQAISDLDTILEDPLDDSPAPEMTQEIDSDLNLDDDLELEEVLDDDLEEAMPLVAGASIGGGRLAQEDPDDDMLSAGFMAAVLVASVIMVMVIPVAFSLSTGRASTLAKTIAGMFS
ncbi:MAG: excisionase family DNA binding protein [Planctomycetota bacterium]